ncbi:hypothetical protein I4U23_024986 [Adineta vaga]|nr:hypothetical protein I4U23_024986 [Adineta vaga]
MFFIDDSVTVRHQFEDNHPFISDAKVSKNKDKFMLIPSIGFENDNQFTMIMNGWYYEPLDSNFIQNLIRKSFYGAMNLIDRSTKFSKEEQEERIGPFFVRDVSKHQIQLKISDSISTTVSTDDNGRFYAMIGVNNLQSLTIKQDVMKYIAFDDDYNQQGDEGLVYLMRTKNYSGCSIISDIDDTIKISEVPNKQKLIINTFKKTFQAVPGMANVYQSWRSSYQCLIHYVSAMPSQLYYVTQKFLNKENFPHGSFHMRHLKVISPDKYNLVKQLSDFIGHNASQRHKLTVIETILNLAPSTQQFIMVGDSGEFDPEIYGEITRRFSNRIKMIFIRLVDGGRNDPNRFENAFKNIPNDKWSTFFDAKDLPRKAD